MRNVKILADAMPYAKLAGPHHVHGQFVDIAFVGKSELVLVDAGLGHVAQLQFAQGYTIPPEQDDAIMREAWGVVDDMNAPSLGVVRNYPMVFDLIGCRLQRLVADLVRGFAYFVRVLRELVRVMRLDPADDSTDYATANSRRKRSQGKQVRRGEAIDPIYEFIPQSHSILPFAGVFGELALSKLTRRRDTPNHKEA